LYKLIEPARSRKKRQWLRRFFSTLGPGLITGAADDDPSGISTYSVAGAQFGFSTLWTALFTVPLMTAVQLMCARLGMVTGRGLAGVVRRRYSARILWPACGLLVVANVVNIGADLAGMGETTAMMTGVTSYVWTALYAGGMIALLFWSSYRRIASIFKWLTLVLFAYIAAAFLARPNWALVLRSTILPHIEMSASYLATLVAIFGTTISPYLFFWQAAQEVEEDKLKGRTTLQQRKGATDRELKSSQVDVITGMSFSNLIMYFIILTTAATLNVHGETHIITAQQAAEALRPVVGKGAYLLFTLGIIGTGLLSVPVLAGSTAYAIAEAAAWRHSLQHKPRAARRFYGVLGVAMLLGLAINYLHFDAVAMLFWSAVVNGVLAPPLVVLVVLLTSDVKVMGNRVNSRLMQAFGWATAAVMAAAAIGMFATMGSS
jgi:NRAMP (natural resistance-associated macrophage protein)-like metal ion transporter